MTKVWVEDFVGNIIGDVVISDSLLEIFQMQRNGVLSPTFRVEGIGNLSSAELKKFTYIKLDSSQSSVNPQCSSCVHSEASVMENGPALECRRYPPQLLLINPDDIARTFPQVDSNDWCGEFEKKE